MRFVKTRQHALSVVITGILITLIFAFFTVDVHAESYPQIVSTALGGSQANNFSSYPSISSDGRYVAFTSYATNLVPGDTTGTQDVFVRDRQTGTTQLVSVAPDGSDANNLSVYPSISADGRYVVFASEATNLVPEGTSGTQIFIRDMQTETTQLVSAASDGSVGNDDSQLPSISADGRYVVFASEATNLVSGGTSGTQIFIRDMQTGTTQLVSATPDGSQADGYSSGPSISPDGQYVAFSSQADNLVSGETYNGSGQVFIRNMQTGTTQLVSTAPDGSVGNGLSDNPHLSDGGQYVAFESNALNLLPGLYSTGEVGQVFIRNMQTGTTQLVSAASDGNQANKSSYNSTISTDGRYVAFASDATNLVASGTNNTQALVFIRDTQTGITQLVSAASDGSQADGYSDHPSISGDGQYVAFYSYADNLVSGYSGGNVFLTLNPFINNSPTPPTVNAITITKNPVQINNATSVSASFLDPSGGSSDTASWNWGDGSTSSGTASESNGSGTIGPDSHTYTALGSYTITLTITNSQSNLSGSSSAVIAVIPVNGLRGSNLSGSNYSRANLDNQNISGSNLQNAIFNNASLQNANLSGSNGSHSSFTKANLTGANLSGANFQYANFTGANLTSASMRGSNFQYANLTNADLTGANLSGANFRNATITGIIWLNTICPNGTNSNNDDATCVGQGGGL